MVRPGGTRPCSSLLERLNESHVLRVKSGTGPSNLLPSSLSSMSLGSRASETGIPPSSWLSAKCSFLSDAIPRNMALAVLVGVDVAQGAREAIAGEVERFEGAELGDGGQRPVEVVLHEA